MATVAAPVPANQYWVGADNNVYGYATGGAFNGVQNLGKAAAAVNNGIAVTHANGVTTILPQSSFVSDPNAPKTLVSGPPNSNGQNSGGAAPVDKSNDISIQNAGLDAQGATTQHGLDAIDASLAGLNSKYDTESAANHANATTQSDTNQTNLQKGKQTALVHAAQGRSGLMGTLSSIGALSGSSMELANRAVQNGANEDLSGAADTFATNQSGIDSSIGTFDAADKDRRKTASDDAENAKAGVRNEGAKANQGFLASLSGDYMAMGNKAEGDRYARLAGDTYKTIGDTSVPTHGPTAATAAYTPGTLGSYINNAGNTSVSTTAPAPGGQPGLVASSTPNKKKQ